jgi:hypothetical protein
MNRMTSKLLTLTSATGAAAVGLLVATVSISFLQFLAS